jgi:hypothetical protein
VPTEEKDLPVESESKPSLGEFLAAARSYLELPSEQLSKHRLLTLGWMDTTTYSELTKHLEPTQLVKLVETALDTLQHSPTLAEKIEQVKSTQEGFRLLGEAAKALLTLETFKTNPKLIDQLVENHGLYLLSAGGETYHLDSHRVVAYLKKNTHVLAGSNELQIATKAKEALQNALQEDIEKLDSMADQALPIFNKEKFNLIEAEHHDPFELIKRSLDHIKELVKVMKGSSRREDLLMPTTRKMLGTGTWLQGFLKSTEGAKQAFNQLVEHFWPYHVGRFILRKNQENDDEEWFELAQPDKAIDKKGFFPVNKLVDKNFSDRLHCVGAVAWATLRTQIIDRREDYQAGVSVSPLPERKTEGYWVVVENDLDDNSSFRKIHVPWEVVAGPEASFESFYRHFEQAFNESPPIDDLTQAARVESLLAEDIDYDSPQHKQNRQDLTNVVDADVRILIDKLTAKKKGVKHLLTSPVANPVGSRTPTVVSLMVLPLPDQKGEAVNLKSVTEISSHRVADGSYLENKELARIVKGIRSGETTRNPVNSRMTLEMPAIRDPSEQGSVEVKLDEEKIGQAYEISLGKEVKDFGDELEDDNNHESLGKITNVDKLAEAVNKQYAGVIDSLYSQCRKGGILYDSFKKEFGIRLNVHTIFTMALMHTLGIQHAHFLEKDGDSITPVPAVLPSELKRLIVMLEKSRLNEEVTYFSQGGSKTDINTKTYNEENEITIEKILGIDLNNIAQGFELFSKGRFEFARRPKLKKNGRYQIGAGPIEVLKVAAGPARNFLTWLAKFTIPHANGIVTDSLLISCLTNSGSGTRSFGSAIDSVYENQGSVAVSDFAENAWRVVIRAGLTDLVKQKYGEGADVEKRLQIDLQQAILDVIVGLMFTLNTKKTVELENQTKAEKAKKSA